MSEGTLLSNVICGNSVFIKKINISGPLGVRLRDLGFVRGRRICPLYSHRGIKAYSVCGTVIALRDADASMIEVEYE